MRAIRLAAPACAVVAALAVGACGSKELAVKDLAKEANAICAKTDAESDKLGSPDLSDPVKAGEFFDTSHDLAKKQQDELKALKPEESIKPEFEELTAASGKATDLLGDLADAAKAKDQKRGRELAGELEPLTVEIDSASKAVGADKCAGA